MINRIVRFVVFLWVLFVAFLGMGIAAALAVVNFFRWTIWVAQVKRARYYGTLTRCWYCGEKMLPHEVRARDAETALPVHMKGEFHFQTMSPRRVQCEGKEEVPLGIESGGYPVAHGGEYISESPYSPKYRN